VILRAARSRFTRRAFCCAGSFSLNYFGFAAGQSRLISLGLDLSRDLISSVDLLS
jgi:hypothetical protein